jgi:nucleotide-binding universal stress UspA family protein
MVTYLVGTDGEPASRVICDYLEGRVGPEDHVEVINVQEGSDVDDLRDGEEALSMFEEHFGDEISVSARQISRGRKPSDELVAMAEEIGADEILTALRRHSRTERIIFGSVSQSLLQRVTIPITLVPLPEYQAPAK